MKISSTTFFSHWIDEVVARKEILIKIWRKSTDFTAVVKGDENSIVQSIADKLGLNCYPRDYYCLDTIMYRPEDRVPGLPDWSYWFRNIRVAFEHENNSRSGLFKELAHLLITDCELKVLVTYPNSDEEARLILERFREIINGNDRADELSESGGLLVIFGYENDFEWNGFIYRKGSWEQLRS